MKAIYMKEFAAATIDKVQEMKVQAEKARLYISVEVNLATESYSISIYELDDMERLKTPSLFFKYGPELNLKGAKKFAKDLEEAEQFISGYSEGNENALTKRQEDLKRQLQAVNKTLRKVRKAANK